MFVAPSYFEKNSLQLCWQLLHKKAEVMKVTSGSVLSLFQLKRIKHHFLRCALQVRSENGENGRTDNAFNQMPSALLSFLVNSFPLMENVYGDK